jgi:hypothetical protein
VNQRDIGRLLRTDVVLEARARIRPAPSLGKYRNQQEPGCVDQMCRGDSSLHTSAINGVNERIVGLLSCSCGTDFCVGSMGGCSQCLCGDCGEITESRSSAELRYRFNLLTPATQARYGVAPLDEMLCDETPGPAGDTDDKDVHLSVLISLDGERVIPLVGGILNGSACRYGETAEGRGVKTSLGSNESGW